MSDEEQSKYEEIAEKVSKRLQKERTKKQVSYSVWIGTIAGAIIAVPILLGGGRTFYAVIDAPDGVAQNRTQIEMLNSNLNVFQSNIDWRLRRLEHAVNIRYDTPKQKQQDQEDYSAATNGSQFAFTQTTNKPPQ